VTPGVKPGRISAGKSRAVPTETPRRKWVTRPYGVALAFTAFLGAFAWRAYDLQISRYNQFATQSNSNYQRDEIIRALRGEIRTSDGLLLAANRMAVDLIYKGGNIAAWEQIRYLSGYKEGELPHVEPGGEVTLVKNVPAEKIPAIYEYTVRQPNLELRERLERLYPQGTFAAHLLGYVGEADAREVEQGGYSLGDLVGKSGLESSMDSVLRGRNGTRRLEVTAAGRPQGEHVVDPGQKGRDVILTINGKLQRAAEQALREALTDVNKGRVKYGLPPEDIVRGAIVALDPRTNEVLAMASSPAFNPNWFAQTPRPKALVDAMLGRSGNALLNRAVQNYDSGSVFKPSSTNAIMEYYGNPVYNCTTAYRFGGALRRNWARRGYGHMDGRGAIAHSCNTWYYQAAAHAGPVDFSNKLAKRARELGFGGPTGVEIAERTGNVPSAIDYEKAGRTWWPGQSLSYAIGQGDLLVTPTQIAYALSTLINEGKKRPLTLIRKVGGERQPAKPVQRVPGSLKNFRLVKEGMVWTVMKGGSASSVLGPEHFPVQTGGKTGTAENAVSRKNIGYTNSWYEGYGPLDDPTFLVVAFFENGGEGYDVALPAVKKMFAARWCIKLDENARVVREDPPQNPCLGELGAEQKREPLREAQSPAAQQGN